MNTYSAVVYFERISKAFSCYTEMDKINKNE